MKDTDKAYVAGLIDGECTVGLTKFDRRCNRAPFVSFPNTAPELISEFMRLCGGIRCTKRIAESNHSPSWTVTVRYANAIKLLRLIRPYMRHADKCYRADMLINEYASVTVRNGKYTAAMKAAKADFERRFFHPDRPSNRPAASL